MNRIFVHSIDLSLITGIAFSAVAAEKQLNAPDQFYSTDIFADYSIDFISYAKSSQPWSLYLAFNAPHFLLDAPESVIVKTVWEGMKFLRTENGKSVYEVGSGTY